MPRGIGSSSPVSRSGEIGAGSVVDGFRVERRLGRGSLGAVYEATQLSLSRRVALRLLDPGVFADAGFAARFQHQQRLSAALHHPNIVPTYEVGEWAGGRFVATRYVGGRSLAALLDEGALSPARLETLLGRVADAMEAAHAAGLVHGRLTGENVLVDARGTPFVTDLGLGRPGSIDDDRRALADLPSGAASGRRRRRSRSLVVPVLAGLAALAVVATVAVVVAGGEDGDKAHEQPPPPIAAGAVALGSTLEAGALRSVGCGERPGPNTPACTLSQATIAGRPIVVRRAGVIRAWAVRGATGELTLQVIGGPEGRPYLRGFSQPERVRDAAPHAFAANVPVRRGDRVGVLLAAGAVIGARPASGGSTALRREGTLELFPLAQSSSRIEREILLRADVEPGARPDLPRQRTGSEAASAAPGKGLADAVIDLSASRVVHVQLVRVGDGIAIDALDGRRRVARIDVPDASPDGRLQDFSSQCGYRRGLCLRWLNPGDGTPLVHAYTLTRDGSAFRVLG